MYLKSIEVHGFKSFANKIVFEFHNGITGIVGPNGSGKSNVADAVRWVLGEQRAKQLRGASMQDVIFAGTENRKPLSYAYVAITLDNADRQLNLDYNEVTIARRVYRSGESEYLMNGAPCRLKDVNELFYDTGIGKEGYSIIGQGQIEKILSGKPEERRELFDEAAGIVKYKRRKATAQKKLEDERANLVRVNDILAELEKQIGPLERQSEKAKIYLKKKEEQKTYDVNLFLMEVSRMEKQLDEVGEKIVVADREYQDSKTSFERIKEQYEKTEQDMETLEGAISLVREELGNTSVLKGKLEGQINVLKEQIHGAEQNEEHFASRREVVLKDKAERESEFAVYEEQAKELEQQLAAAGEKRDAVMERYSRVAGEIARCQEGIEQGKNEIIELLNNKASTKARMQRYDTMMEQVNIRKAQLSKRLLERKGEEETLSAMVADADRAFEEVNQHYTKLTEEEQRLTLKRREWQEKLEEVRRKLEEDTTGYHREQSRLESMMNIAERYDGYGNSIRRVMECREKEPGILGVVADIIKVEKTYEVAIETALGGSIQNIVTAEEDTAKRMIQYLKQNRYGRATFLPLTSIGKKEPQINQKALSEPGVIGMGNTLVHTEARFEGLAGYLLGRTYVVDHIDHAIALARKYQYSLRIVTLEGESLSPGGSMTGGAFKNTSNLLGRKREIEELEKKVAQLKEAIAEHRRRLEDIQTARELLKDDLAKVQEELKDVMVKRNTAKLNAQRVREQKQENDESYTGLKTESHEIEEQIRELNENKEVIRQEIAKADEREKEIEEENVRFQKILEEQSALQEQVQTEVSGVQLEEANISQKAGFVQENVTRIRGEIRKLMEELAQIQEDASQSQEDIKKKQHDIEEIEKTIAASVEAHSDLEERLLKHQQEKEAMAARQKGFFQKREEISEQISNLDKELFRLNNQKEKLTESLESQNNYMWEEYELTYHNAMSLRNEEYQSAPQLKQLLSAVKDEIKKLGDVNVNAIEDYKNLSERYTFLKTQHDDLVTAEKTLMDIIEDLDTGMRKQFMEKFAEIQREFDKAFKELFGGGKGSLELVEDEDILECGIRIIAQPPGKKLQNMMQLSGGEKSLTAISLLFAIQNLKPSPFCLLDEIEAALDDSNVGRFAQYLHRLTKNTQFIVITHRRGTMAAADRLYGITMQEKGVSTLVSVNLIEEGLDD